MSLFRKAHKEDELILVFNIGSSSVKGALFHMQKSGIPKIIYSIREPILIEENVDIARFLTLALKSLDIVVNEIYKKGLGAPSRVFCVLLSPWYVSQTRIISLKRDKPFTFTTKLADELIQKEIAVIKDEYFKKYTHIGDSLRPIELRNIKISLNGYETDSPLDKVAEELEMAIFVSVSAEEVCRKIEQAIARRFAVKEVKFCSFTMATFAVVRDMYADVQDFLLINVGGEVTDIAMVKNGVLRESNSFALGINFMIRAIASTMHSTLPEAKSLISLFKDGHAAAGTAKLLEPAITKLKSEWLTKFQECLSNLSNDISIPAIIYITVDKDLADFFAEIIKTEQFSQYTLTESKFQIVFLSSESLHGIATFEKEAIFNAFLAIDSVYINRFFK